MAQFFVGIEQIIDIQELQRIQDTIARATGLAIITVDYSGRPLTEHSCRSAFCTKVRSSQYGKYCEKCDSHGGIEAARLHAPYIYFCHAGLVDFAIPFWVDNQYLGAFMGGQVLLDDQSDASELEYILPRSNFPTQSEKTFQEIAVMSLEHIRALADMLMHFGTLLIRYYQIRKVLQVASYPQAAPLTNVPLSNPSVTKTEHSAPERTSAIIDPAMKYLYLHPAEKISVKKMADLCGISTSYFSKLFMRENLCSLSQYTNRIRVGQAIQLLKHTNLSVRQVAEKLGFDDCGYFIKVFKRFTGLTPLEYQKANKVSG